MSKAEEAALKAYPIKMTPLVYQDLIDQFGGKTEIDVNTYPRCLFQQGYEQAEKDLGWVSVKDRLPEEPGYYITCCEDNGVAQAIGLTFYNSDIQSWLDYDDIKCIVYVDYWMEVPKLKK